MPPISAAAMMRSNNKRWTEGASVQQWQRSYYGVSQPCAQTTHYTLFEDVLMRVGYLQTRSDAAITINFTEDFGKTFRFVSAVVTEAVRPKVLRALAGAA